MLVHDLVTVQHVSVGRSVAADFTEDVRRRRTRTATGRRVTADLLRADPQGARVRPNAVHKSGDALVCGFALTSPCSRDLPPGWQWPKTNVEIVSGLKGRLDVHEPSARRGVCGRRERRGGQPAERYAPH